LHDLTVVKRSEQMRADFVANASHELRTPLAAVTGFIETLRGHAKDDADAASSSWRSWRREPGACGG
jgi:two-component system phosphate regulon sensor histidine kinase PhoR